MVLPQIAQQLTNPTKKFLGFIPLTKDRKLFEIDDVLEWDEKVECIVYDRSLLEIVKQQMKKYIKVPVTITLNV